MSKLGRLRGSGLQEQAQMCSLKYTEKKDSDPAPREEYDPIDVDRLCLPLSEVGDGIYVFH